jgi:zinc transporter ZupT
MKTPLRRLIHALRQSIANKMDGRIPIFKTNRRFVRVWAILMATGWLVGAAGAWIGVAEVNGSSNPTFADKIEISKTAGGMVVFCVILLLLTLVRSADEYEDVD